jgi:hypothetical protein
VTADNYLCPENEKGHYHVIQERLQFDPNTGARVFSPVLQKYRPLTFEMTVYPYLSRGGYNIRIVHDPRKYAKDMQEYSDQVKKAKQEKALEELREQIRQEERKKVLAELKKEEKKGGK